MDNAPDAGFLRRSQHIGCAFDVYIFKRLIASLADDANQMNDRVNAGATRFQRGSIENISPVYFGVFV